MSYLQDRKTKRNKIVFTVITLLLLVFLFYFRSGVFGGLSYLSGTVFRPVFVLGNNFGNKFSNSLSFFTSKSSLQEENENLKSQLSELEASMSNYNAISSDNSAMQEILGRKNESSNMILSAILAKPNQSPYDTLVIDVGSNNGGGQGASVGDLVFAKGDVPIGRVSDVYPDSSKVILFSNPGEKTEAVISGRDIFTSIIGRGGGNYEMIVSRELVLEKGSLVVLPGLKPYVVGIVETIISDPRDANTRALLVSPVNIQELKFVQVVK